MSSHSTSSPPPLPTVQPTDATVAVPQASIDWYRSLPWWRLWSQAVSISWRASHLLLAAIAMGVTYAGWYLSGWIFAPPGFERGTFLASSDWLPTLPERMSAFMASLQRLLPAGSEFTVQHFAYMAFGFLWTIGVWSFAGGLLARRTLMEMGIRTSVGWGPSCRLVCRRWLAMVWSMCMPLVALLGLALFPFLLGLIARLGVVGETMALILMIPSIFLAIGIGWCAAITAFGFPLSICAITVEKNADAFDGISRSAAYVFQRPLTMLLLLIVAGALGWFGDWVVRMVLSMGEGIVWGAFTVGLGDTLATRVGQQPGTRQALLVLVQSIIPSLQSAFIVSFFWSAAAAAYLILRWEIDHTDFDELDLQELGEPIAVPSLSEIAPDQPETTGSATP